MDPFSCAVATQGSNLFGHFPSEVINDFTERIDDMHIQLKRGVRNLVTLTAGIAVLLLGFLATPASADAVTGTLTDKFTYGVSVKITGEDHEIPTTLFTLKLSDGSEVQAYCIDFTVDAKINAKYIEDDWKNYPNASTKFKAQPDKVNWILHNSYPHHSLTELQVASGIVGLSEKQAIAGTQSAIWHFSNGTNLADGNDAKVADLYNYLIGPKNVGLTAEPQAALNITPENATGQAGSDIGPFTVNTTAPSVNLQFNADSGAKLVNQQGNEVTTASNGDKLSVRVPAGAQAGNATIKAHASTTVETGRLFRGDNVKTQTLITAKTTKTVCEDQVTASWQPGPATPSSVPPSTPPVTPSAPHTTPVAHAGPSLPVTGAQAGLIGGIGAVLIGGGVAMYVVTRRRKSATKASS